MGHDSGEVLLIAITEKQQYAVGSQQEGHLVEDALRHGQGPLTDIDRQEQLLSGFMATQTQCGERDRHSIASSSPTLPL